MSQEELKEDLISAQKRNITADRMIPQVKKYTNEIVKFNVVPKSI
jgi:hypothetical protein